MQIGRYVVERELGRGGMGVVYAARAPSGEHVAIKVLLDPATAGEEGMARFERETQACLRLSHPNVVRFLDAGFAGRPYLVTEFLAGESLHEALRRRGAFDALDAARLVADLAGGLAHAHRAGVLHRDLKPENVLLAAEGVSQSGVNERPVLVDFGLARLGGNELERLTLTGELLGTPSYMAPEQALGDVARIGPAVDVYGLGGLLYAMLTARAPHERGADSLLVLLNRVVSGPPPSPGQFASIPPQLEAICMRCLALEPDERYASAEELERELRSFTLGIHSRSRVPAIAGGALLLALGGLIGAAVAQSDTSDPVSAASLVPSPASSATAKGTPLAEQPSPSPAPPPAPWSAWRERALAGDDTVWGELAALPGSTWEDPDACLDRAVIAAELATLGARFAPAIALSLERCLELAPRLTRAQRHRLVLIRAFRGEVSDPAALDAVAKNLALPGRARVEARAAIARLQRLSAEEALEAELARGNAAPVLAFWTARVQEADALALLVPASAEVEIERADQLRRAFTFAHTCRTGVQPKTKPLPPVLGSLPLPHWLEPTIAKIYSDALKRFPRHFRLRKSAANYSKHCYEALYPLVRRCAAEGSPYSEKVRARYSSWLGSIKKARYGERAQAAFENARALSARSVSVLRDGAYLRLLRAQDLILRKTYPRALDLARASCVELHEALELEPNESPLTLVTLSVSLGAVLSLCPPEDRLEVFGELEDALRRLTRLRPERFGYWNRRAELFRFQRAPELTQAIRAAARSMREDLRAAASAPAVMALEPGPRRKLEDDWNALRRRVPAGR